MQIKNTVGNISIFLFVITALFFSFQASAQDATFSNESDGATKDPSITDTDPVTVSVKVFNMYCKDSVGFGEVYFIAEPHEGALFQTLGEYLSGGKVTYTFHPGKHDLPIGVYTWKALPTSNIFSSPEPSTGKFTVDIKCDTTTNVNEDPTGSVDVIYINDSDINESAESTTNTVATLESNSSLTEENIINEIILNIDGSTDVVLEETESSMTKEEDLTDPDKLVIRSILSGTHVLFLETQYADLVEWYIKREPGDTFKYLGAATLNKENSMWEYVWNTTQVPNGDYVLVPKIRSDLGKEYKDTPSYITVKNKEENIVGTEDTTLVSDVKKAIPQIVRVDEDLREAEDIAKENIIDVTTLYYDKVREYINSDQSTALEKEEFTKEQERSEEYLRRLLDVESNKLLEGVLDDDEEKKKRIREKIIMASNSSLDRIDEIARKFGIELSDKELELIRKEMEIRMFEFEKIIEEKKEILRGRVGPNVFEDSDKDGISNYDEINIYGTDPFDADSDKDGYVDGAEIMGGFDPKDPSVEAVTQYEEPTMTGYVEEEIFSIDSISVKEIEIDEKGKEKVKKISFQGTAPANSFVTLYIYSTPIIVTVKTDENGNWSYVLDKELEDGNHEIYVAITDNAGKIFAKSKPLPFVKEAAAVTINEGLLFGGGDTEPSVFDGRYLYVIVLLVIVIIGWVLMRTGPSKNI